MFYTFQYKGRYIHVKTNGNNDYVSIQGVKPWYIKHVKSIHAAKILISKEVKQL